MKSRMSIKQTEPGIYEAMNAGEKVIASFGLNPKLIELIKIRVSQINHCGYCLNIHNRDAKKLGETEQRLYTLSAWWETPFFTQEEQAALRLAEQVTLISEKGVSDQVYEDAVKIFGERKVAQLIYVVIAISGWNRIAISTSMVADQA